MKTKNKNNLDLAKSAMIAAWILFIMLLIFLFFPIADMNTKQPIGTTTTIRQSTTTIINIVNISLEKDIQGYVFIANGTGYQNGADIDNCTITHAYLLDTNGGIVALNRSYALHMIYAENMIGKCTFLSISKNYS